MLDEIATDSLLEEVREAAPYWPADLSLSGAHARGQPRNRQKLTGPYATVFVQTADRCGVLRPALEAFSRRNAAGRRLLAMHDVITFNLFGWRPL